MDAAIAMFLRRRMAILYAARLRQTSGRWVSGIDTACRGSAWFDLTFGLECRAWLSTMKI
jgi:hypothetical protein